MVMATPEARPVLMESKEASTPLVRNTTTMTVTMGSRAQKKLGSASSAASVTVSPATAGGSS